MDKISIVVAVYNAEKFLKKCIDSLINQTYENTEIILVNDFSTDNSLQICNEYSSRYENIIVVSNEGNFGVSATRNKGIDISTGKYICFVDSDDYVETNYIQTLYDYYQKYNTVPICGFVYHDEYNHCKPVNYTWSGGAELVNLGEAFRLNDELYLTALWNKLFDNNVVKLKNIRFDEKLSSGEDLRFSVEYLKITGAESVYAFSDTLYHYTKLTNSTLMSNVAKNGISDAIDNLKIIKSLAKKFNYNTENIFVEKIEILKNNLIYFIVRDKDFANDDKLKKIQEFKQEFTKKDLRKEKFRAFKEKIATFFNH
jgi:glycosyltransferase involved in cell wall biosynthesis